LNHPYKEYENTEMWSTIWQALDELAENDDIEETTPRGYIVGYLCEKIEEMND